MPTFQLQCCSLQGTNNIAVETLALYENFVGGIEENYTTMNSQPRESLKEQKNYWI